jgi:hypothetical protein
MERMIETMYRRAMQRTVMAHCKVHCLAETFRSHRVNKEVYTPVHLLVIFYIIKDIFSSCGAETRYSRNIVH